MHTGVNKGEAVKTLQESLGILPEETMVFGDQLNDIEMLNRPTTALPWQRQKRGQGGCQNFRTDTNVNDGVLKILKRLL